MSEEELYYYEDFDTTRQMEIQEKHRLKENLRRELLADETGR
jgi:hypothetical protein